MEPTLPDVQVRRLTGEQLAERSVPPSTMSLLGLVRHMAEVERHWFRRGFRGERLEHAYRREDRPDAAFDEVDPARAEEDFVRLNQEWELSRQAVAAASLDDTFISERWDEMSLRWIYGHMIEEYARHIGHADLLRERVAIFGTLRQSETSCPPNSPQPALSLLCSPNAWTSSVRPFWSRPTAWPATS